MIDPVLQLTFQHQATTILKDPELFKGGSSSFQKIGHAKIMKNFFIYKAYKFIYYEFFSRAKAFTSTRFSFTMNLRLSIITSLYLSVLKDVDNGL